MGKFVHQLANQGSYMLRNAQTLDRIVAVVTAGSELDFYVDKDRATVDPNHTPLYLKLNPSTVNDLFCNIELGIQFAAGSVFYVEGMTAGTFATLIFS